MQTNTGNPPWLFISGISQLGYIPWYLEILSQSISLHSKPEYQSRLLYYVFPYFRNWIFAIFLKWTKLRLSISSPTRPLMWWSLLAVVFIPILVLQFLKIWKLSCLLVQMIWSITVTCSKLRTFSCLFKNLCNLRAIW